MSQTESVRLPRFRLSLLDLMVIVLAAGLSAGLARGVKRVWMNFPESVDRPAGAATMVLAVWLCVPLLRQILAFSRDFGGRRGRIWPIGWRMFSCAILAWMAIEQGANLRHRPEEPWFSPMEPPGNFMPILMRFGVLPIFTTLMLAGALSAISAARETSPPRYRGLPIRWLLVPLVAIAGLLMIGLASYLAYLVLIAVDGVTNALTSRSGRVLPDILMRDAPSLNARLHQTGRECLIAWISCVFLGIFLSKDLHSDRSVERFSWRIALPRICLLIVNVLIFLRLVFFAIPNLHPSLYGGMLLTFEGRDVSTFVLGFGLFGAGLAARAVSPRVVASQEERMVRKFGRGAGVALVLGLTALTIIGYGATTPTWTTGSAPWLLEMLLKMADLYAWIGGRFPVAQAMQFWSVDLLVWGLVLAWLAAKIAVINLRRPGCDPVPMDQIAASYDRLAWFLWCTLAMIVLCLTALPTFALGGLVVEHCRYVGLWNF